MGGREIFPQEPATGWLKTGIPSGLPLQVTGTQVLRPSSAASQVCYLRSGSETEQGDSIHALY